MLFYNMDKEILGENYTCKICHKPLVANNKLRACEHYCWVDSDDVMFDDLTSYGKANIDNVKLLILIEKASLSEKYAPILFKRNFVYEKKSNRSWSSFLNAIHDSGRWTLTFFSDPRMIYRSRSGLTVHNTVLILIEAESSMTTRRLLVLVRARNDCNTMIEIDKAYAIIGKNNRRIPISFKDSEAWEVLEDKITERLSRHALAHMMGLGEARINKNLLYRRRASDLRKEETKLPPELVD